MNNVTKFDISTKPAAGMDAIKSHVTVDWTGMSEEDIRALAQQALVVKLQANMRRGYEKNGIPSTIDVKAKDYKVGTRAPKQAVDILAVAQKLSPEEKAELIKKLQEG
jgi:queuine/archaeosine tRNA-ribosyltransferase